MHYLITGASGFVAGHLIECILKEDVSAKITALDISNPNYYFIDSDLRQSICFVLSDLLDMDDLKKLIEVSGPDFIIHLASSSSVAYSWQYPVESFRNNSNIYLNLLEALRQCGSKARVLSIGSSEQYGAVPPNCLLLKESMVCNPVSPYAVARVTQELMASIYFVGYKLDIVNTRSFNHVGPRQDGRFVLSGFSKYLAEIRKNKRKPVLHVGDLSIIRDFTDVRDIVKGYMLLLTKGINGEVYNICSGIGKTIEEYLEIQLQIAKVECKIIRDEKLIRPMDNPTIIGDNFKIKNQTGWFPEIPIENTLLDLYEYWQRKLD